MPRPRIPKLNPGRPLRVRPRPSDVVRFLNKVVVNAKETPKWKAVVGPCWDWAGRLDDNGYGQFWFDGQAHGAHRFSFQALRPVGSIEPGQDVDHVCARHCCVNPDHLRPHPKEESSRQGGVRSAARTPGSNGKYVTAAAAAGPEPDYADCPI